jgi:hypothetical protein
LNQRTPISAGRDEHGACALSAKSNPAPRKAQVPTDLVPTGTDGELDAGDGYDLLSDDAGPDVGEPADDEGGAVEPLDAGSYEPPKVAGGWDLAQLTPLLEIAERHGIPTGAADAVLGAYGRQADQLLAQRRANDDNDRDAVVESLKESWGPNYTEYRQHAKDTLKALPADLRKSLRTARLNDGMGGLLLNNAEFVELLSDMGRTRAEASAPRTGSDRLQQIDEIMRTDRERYFREKLDKEKLRLVAAGHGR